MLRRAARCPTRIVRGQATEAVHHVEKAVAESQHRKSAKSAFATKGEKFASLTSDYIHFLRPHEPRRAEHAHQGARRAPWIPFNRQNTGMDHSSKGLRARTTLQAAADPRGHAGSRRQISTKRAWQALAQP